MGLLERWDQRNQRTLEWHNERARRAPVPRFSRLILLVLVGIVMLRAIGALVEPKIGAGGWLAVLLAVAAVCFFVAYRLSKRERRRWEGRANGQQSSTT